MKRATLAAIAMGTIALVSGCAFGQATTATQVTSTSATLQGVVASHLQGNTPYWFRYGITAAYGTETPHRTVAISASEPYPVSEAVTGLSPSTTYHFQLCAQDSDQPKPICTGGDKTFTTASASEPCPEPGSFGAGNWPPACWRPYATAGAQWSPFNRAISPSPRVEAESTAMVESVVGEQLFPIVAAPGDTRDGGVPVYWSKASDPLVTLDCTAPADWGTCPLENVQIRVPAEARPAGGYDPEPWDHDAHMTVVDQQSGWEYDLYNVQVRTASKIEIGFGGRTRIDGDGLGSAAVAAHYGGLAGLIRVEELEAGVIDHALLIVVPCTNGTPVYPADADGSVCEDTRGKPAMGAHFQLDMTQAQIDALQAPEWQRTIYTALRKYGAYVSDTTDGEHWGLEIESPSSYESFSGYGGSNNPWAGLASRFGIGPADFNEDGHDEYWFYWSKDGSYDGPPSIDWHNLRVLEPCSADGTC
jgi:hypothetical protein